MADPVPLLETLHPLRQPPGPETIVPILVMLGVGVLLGLLLVACFVALRARGRRVRRSALAELASSRALNPAERLAAQALLLRRLVRTTAVDMPAHENGGAWLDRLDRTFDTTYFSRGEGRAFGESLYTPETRPDIEALDRSLVGFIGKVRR